MLEQRRARTTWLTGARAFHQKNHEEAAVQFERAVTLDEGLADAWLGLHATSRKQGEAIAAMAKHEHRFGQERRRNNLALTSRFDIGPYVRYGLESHLDLWCAVAAGHLDRDEHDLAASALRRTAENVQPAVYLRGRLACVTGDREGAITHFRGVIGGDKFLEASARLLSGIMLAEAGATAPARDHLNWVLRQKFLPAAHAETLYFLGLIARVEGDEDTAMRHFHHAYARRPRLDGLKEAMEQHEPEARIRPARAERARTEEPANSIPDSKPVETVEQVLADLDKQIGQDGIKQQVRGLLAQTRAQIARRDAGLQRARMTEHFVFTGPPGTGKTTIARIVARLYKALQILDSGHVVEVDRSGLIGEYHGHTVARTKEKCDQAMGGILFIDEAYALQTEGFTNGDPFGQEAINTLLKRMEDDRDNLVVIAAGYPEPMQRFLDSNPGLRSRFTTTIDFTGYIAWELVQIADSMAIDTGNTLTDDARTALGLVLDVMDAQGEFASSTFGNARFVRNLIEKAARQRDLRLFSAADTAPPEVSVLTELTAADINAAAGTLS